jgi:type II secretory pathway pseudopilin PulG
MSRERGSALVIAVLILAVLTLLGMSYLLMADTENKIAENERLSAQALYFAEGVTREVRRWFDRPPYTARGVVNLVRPTTAVMDREGREIDIDGPGPVAPVTADGSLARPFYKAGVDNDRDTNDDIFDKPYRSALKDMFVGTADGPDIQMDRTTGGSATVSFLDALADKIMPGFPAGAANILARIRAIKIYEPPYIDVGSGTWIRYGIATVSTRVQILRNSGTADEQVLADRTLTTVLNEAPYGGAFGPLHSCDELGWDNAFRVHWGAATASSTANLPPTALNGMSRSIPRDLPPTPRVDAIHGHLSPAGDADWTDVKTNLEDQPIEDPWFRFFAGLSVQNWSTFGSPQVYPPLTGGQDRSNRFQDYPYVPCPDFNYETWKAIAKSGGSDVHYYAWAGGARFSENGTGPPTDFEEITNGKTGLFFFDTKDGLAPHDFDASNVAANLTPDIRIGDADYGTRGFLYVNTTKWRVDGASGKPATFRLPGEPFRDVNENGVKDPTELWINLRYGAISDINSVIYVDKDDTYDTSIPPPATPAPVWNPLGPSVTHDAIVWGILYLSGQFEADGTPYYDGSVITFAGTETGAKTPGTANLYWDPMLKENWPPPDWDLPRVIITGWQTDE